MMNVTETDTNVPFSLPVALIFSNGTDVNGRTGYDGNAVLDNSSHRDWNKIAGPGSSKPEKIGETMTRELKWAFMLHTYGFGCLFFILAFYTFFSVLNLRSFISSRPFMSTINGFLCLLGGSRAGSLLIDPYNLKENMPRIIGQILWDLGFPSIISAFCLVQLAFLQLTQLQIGPEGLRRKSCLSLIVTAHFTLTVGMDIVVASHENLMIIKHVVHYIFLAWGVILCSNFLYSGYKVMAMIRNIPGGLKYRDLPDPSYKGIMQLAILAPHNNLAGSVTAALLPTLCAPKIHQQDNTSLSAVGFRNDGNSRILESESIPMLEEMAGSSGDEKSSKLLNNRGSSFQNQTRNTQKFNLKPKLSLRSVSDEDVREEEAAHVKTSSPKSPKPTTPKNQSPKSLFSSSSSSGRGNEFDFNVRPTTGGILKNTETFVTTKSIQEFKSKIHSRTGFENENFQPGNSRKKSKTEGTIQQELTIPNILISCPENVEDQTERENNEMETRKQRMMKKKREGSQGSLMEVINDMEIVREEKKTEEKEDNGVGGEEGEEAVEVHVEKVEEKTKGEPGGTNKRGSQNADSRKSSCKKDSLTGDSAGSECSVLTEITKIVETTTSESLKTRGRKKSKSLSWKKKNQEDEEEKEDAATRECLLSQENTTDVSLRSVLNHIAYINRSHQGNSNGPTDELDKTGKSNVEWVLNITYITAMWGLMLCLSNMGRIYSPFGVAESRKLQSSPSSPPSSSLSSSATQWTEAAESRGPEILFSPWPWLWFQTFCRALELAMGCAMANITRQPSANYRYPRALSLRHRDNFYNI